MKCFLTVLILSVSLLAQSDPIAYFPFDGSTADKQGSTVTASSIRYEAGKVGQAARFWSGEIMNVAGDKFRLYDTSVITISMWQKIVDTEFVSVGSFMLWDAMQSHYLISNMSLDINTMIFNNGRPICVRGNGTDNLVVPYTKQWEWHAEFSKDGWVHIIVTFDNKADSIFIYKNGIMLGKNKGYFNPVSWASIGQLQIARVPAKKGTDPKGRPTYEQFSTGCIDELKIFNRRLTDLEALILYDPNYTRIIQKQIEIHPISVKHQSITTNLLGQQLNNITPAQIICSYSKKVVIIRK